MLTTRDNQQVCALPNLNHLGNLDGVETYIDPVFMLIMCDTGATVLVCPSCCGSHFQIFTGDGHIQVTTADGNPINLYGFKTM